MLKRLLFFFLCFAQHWLQGQAPGDANMLLNNVRIQIEATEAVNDLYNFKFEKAEQQFRWIKQMHPNHPLPYFLLGLSNWWKIVPNTQNEAYDDAFLMYMDSAILLAEYRHDHDINKIEAAFFLAAAYGFKGRLYSERMSWRKAAWNGKKALDYLDESKGQATLSPEFLFGEALFNYYAVWIPENYPMLKPILSFFPKGDKELGVKQLREVANNAFYTRTEAQMFLVRILSTEEGKPREALPLAEYLNVTFPDNAYFERAYARLLYSTGEYQTLRPVCKNILQRIDSGAIGYEATSGRYAAFFLAESYRLYKQTEESKYYYQMAVSFGEEIEAYETGYYLYSLLYLAKMADEEGDYKEAQRLYEQIKKYAKRKLPVHEQAREYLKKKNLKKKRRR